MFKECLYIEVFALARSSGVLKSVLIMALEVLCYGFCITICPGGSRALDGRKI